MNWIKENIKYIIISLTILLSGILIAKSLSGLGSIYRDSNYNNKIFQPISYNNSRASTDTYEQNLETESSYYVTRDTGAVEVWQNEKLMRYEGTALKASFYHVGQMLKVIYTDENGVIQFMFFNHPDRWQIVK